MPTDAEDQKIELIERSDVQSFSVKYWWLNLVRGLAALAIGIGLLLPVEVFFRVDHLKTILFQFIGIYLLISGIMSLIWGFSSRRKFGLWLLAGILGVTGGIAFFLRSILVTALSADVLTITFGLIMLLAGFIHFLGGFRLSEAYGRRWSWSHEFLGLVEIGTGILIFVSLFVSVENLRIILSSWGLVAGVGLLADGIRMRNLKSTVEESKVSQLPDLRENDSAS
jgi:uncharacterized membrane protein HdeD (DUF308 family)